MCLSGIQHSLHQKTLFKAFDFVAKWHPGFACLFVLIIYILVNNFAVMLGRVIKCLAQGHNAVPPESLDPALSFLYIHTWYM